ncbi:MAG: redoxin domain-containing protein [Nanoarchaeota archaeon]
MKKHIIVIAILVVLLVVIQGCSLYVLTQSKEQPATTPTAQKQSIKQPTPQVQITASINENVVNESIEEKIEGAFEGQYTPDFVFQLMTGETIIKNRALKERPLVLYTLTTYCLPCQEELHEMKQMYPLYKNRIRFIAMSVDATEDNEVLERFRSTYPSSTSIIELALYKPETLASLQMTHAGTKIGIQQDGQIIIRSDDEFEKNDWKDFFDAILEIE